MNYSDDVLIFRAELEAYFREQAAAGGVSLAPVDRERKEILLSGRLYEESKGNRLLIFYKSQSKVRDIDAFEKNTGLDDQVSLVGVFSTLSPKLLPHLWQVRVKWLVEGISASDVVGFANSGT